MDLRQWTPETASTDGDDGPARALPARPEQGRGPRGGDARTRAPHRSRAGRLAAAAGMIVLAAGLLGAAARIAGRAAGAGQMLDLRVIGASNQPADQAVKLQVRDAVLALLAPALANAGSEAQAQAYIAAHLPAVRRVAAAVAGRDGQTVGVRLGPAPLPARHIGLLSFPAGRVAALVVTLGPGLGHNWWTVLFPPLAFVTVDGNLTVVGPAGAAEPVRDLSPAERQALLRWVSGQARVNLDEGVAPGGPGGVAGAQVQVRFAVWDLLRRLPWGDARRDLLAWIGVGPGSAVDA